MEAFGIPHEVAAKRDEVRVRAAQRLTALGGTMPEMADIPRKVAEPM